MVAHSHTLESHAIPSKYKAVNEFEAQFVSAFNKVIAQDVDDVMRYVAQQTAAEMKYGIDVTKAVSGEIEKAHQVGDIHPNGKWVWTEYKPGKFDWRNLKRPSRTPKVAPQPKLKPKRIEIWDVDPAIDKFKTAKAVEDYIKQLGIIDQKSSITRGCNLQAVKEIYSAILHLHNKIPFQQIHITTSPMGSSAYASAGNGEHIYLNSKFFKKWDGPTEWSRSEAKYPDINKATLDKAVKELQKAKAEFDKLDKEVNRYLADHLAGKVKYDPTMTLKIRERTRWRSLVNKLEPTVRRMTKSLKYPCFNYGHKQCFAADIVLHELGHILNAQCTGACRHHNTKVYQQENTAKEIAYHRSLNNERDKLWKQNCNEPTVISEYSTTKGVEWFAENFVAWLHNDPKQPKYVKDYYDKYFTTTVPKR